jgi:hypothetical protein
MCNTLHDAGEGRRLWDINSASAPAAAEAVCVIQERTHMGLETKPLTTTSP